MSEQSHAADLAVLAGTAARIGVWDLDTATGQVVADERVLEMFGGLDVVSGLAPEPFFDRIHPDDRRRTLELMDQALASCGSLETPYRVVWPDGSVRHLLSRGRAFPGPDGRAVRLVGAITDVTGLAEEAGARLRALDVDLGVERLRQALVRLGALPVEQLADALLLEMLPDGGEDDVALVVVRDKQAQPAP